MKKKKPNTSSLFESITSIYIACMVSIFLVFPGLGGYAQITLHKWILFMILSCGYILVALLLRAQLVIVGGHTLPNPVQLWKDFSLPQKLILIFWLLSVLSTVFSVNRSIALWGSGRCEGLLTITIYCWCFLLISHYGKPKPWLLGLFGAGISLNCMVALLQFAGLNPFLLYPQGMNYYDGNVRYAGEFLGTIGNVDILSALLCVAIPAFWIAILKCAGKRRFLLLIPLVLSLYVLLNAFVAGGVVGIIGSFLLSIPILAADKKRRRLLSAAVGCIIVIGLLLVYFFGPYVGGFVYEASELLHGHWNDDFGSGRLYIWRNVAELLPERLLLGGGPDTLGLRLDAIFERYDENLGILIRSTIDNAHNEYLNILVNQGLPALLCWLAALIAAAVHWIKNAATSPACAICGGAVLGYCIQAFFGISSPISAPYFWIVFALLCNTLPRLNKHTAKEGWLK